MFESRSRSIRSGRFSSAFAGIGPTWLRHPLTHERFPLAALSQIIPPGATVFDIGANIGTYTRFMAGPFRAGRVVAFEPMTENRELLLRNIELGKIEDRVTVVPYALCDHDGSASLQIDDMQTGSAALDAVTHGKPSEGRAALGLPAKTELINCRTLDSLLADGNLPPPAVLKIDIEGAERMMLEGARNVLATIGPDLLIELHGADVARQVSELLLEFGYRILGAGMMFGAAYQGFVDQAAISRIVAQYDLHFIIASKDPSAPSRIDTDRLSFRTA